MKAVLISNPVRARRRVLASGVALGAILISCVAQIAHAIPSPAGIAGTVSFNRFPPNPNPIDVGTFGTHELTGPSGNLLLDAGLGPSPFLFAEGSIVENFFGRSSAILRYELEVVGDDGLIPVLAFASARVQGTTTSTNDPFAGFAARALWWLEDTSGQQVFMDGLETGSIAGSFADAFERTTELNLIANRTYRVNLLADIGVRGGSALAFIDPIFSFGAGFGSGYSFLFSEGVGNGPVTPPPGPDPTPVPEPSTLGLLLSGLILLGSWRMLRPRER